MNANKFNQMPYDYEIPIPPFHPMLPRKGVHGVKAVDGRGFKTIEECVEVCKAKCKELGVDFIGCELSAKQCEFAKKRVEDLMTEVEIVRLEKKEDAK